MKSLRDAFGLLTALPVGRAGGAGPVRWGRVMLWSPVVGTTLGGLAAGVAWTGVRLGAPSLLAGVLAVAVLAVATRALHLDGLADTVDALGSGRVGPAAREVMRRSDIGPFGVVALVVVLVAQASAYGEVPLAAAVAAATGRVAMLWACRPAVAAAGPDGLGALVAGTVATRDAVLWTVVAVAAGGPAVVVGLLAGGWLRRRACARVGGVTGDVLGATCEAAATVAAVGAVLVGAGWGGAG